MAIYVTVYRAMSRITLLRMRELSPPPPLFSLPERSGGYVRFEVFTAVTMKNGVFWVVTPRGSCKNPEDTILQVVVNLRMAS
jgi:hypothetical protein